MGTGTDLMSPVQANKRISCGVIKSKPMAVVQGLLARVVREGFCEEGTSELKPKE